VAADSADDVTRLAGGTAPATTDSGWARTTSGSIDHGRFEPGVILDNRYRILGLLGRGGMGEVYRADDLRLGQPVALKFLPAALSTDPARLAQFHNEVRTARQVSHPHVCRVYDLGEVDRQLFITMEYVDGEDLSLLLRRIGRLPEDKGVDIARQICAGLAAAHERGVLHRDLKPANIMLDGAGRVRIMDFSLAAAGEVTDIRAGTPAYMAPEQLAGEDVSARSDVYALGLVLYEIFTGRRAFEANNLSELLEQHRAGTLTAPTMIVKALDPAIELAILRCLDPLPARRPSSAIAVSAALPGGDPLAAALAAGETPSPEMVAAAGGEGAALGVRAGALWLTVAATTVIGTAVLLSRYQLVSYVPVQKPAAVLEDHAEAIRRAAGFTAPVVDRASGFGYDTSYLAWVAAHADTVKWSSFASDRPAVITFWYRTSPSVLVPLNTNGAISPGDPPSAVNGMSRMVLDMDARLLSFEATPPQLEQGPPPNPPPPADWQPFFTAAGLDRSAFTVAEPARTPGLFADARQAWKGMLPGTDIPIAIEAASYRGRAVMFQIVYPWTPATREPQSTGNGRWMFVTAMLIVAAFASYRNLRRGRADRRGAFRIAAFLVVVLVAGWAAGRHVASGADELQRFFARAGLALFVGFAMYLLYLALEPAVRRLWPSMLVAWTRVLSGRLRDPLVGRDALIGIAAGAALTLVTLVPYFTVGLTGRHPTPSQMDLTPLLGLRGVVLTLVQAVSNGMQNTLVNVFVYSAFRAIFEWVTRTPLGGARWTIGGRLRMSSAASDYVFAGCVIVVSAALAAADSSGAGRAVAAVETGAETALVLFVLLRAGIFAVAVMSVSSSLLDRMPITFDSASLFAVGTFAALAMLLGVAAAGFRVATRAKSAYPYDHMVV
jgi:protein kinase-like protein